MLNEYYANPHVRARILEFLGGRSPDQTSCHFLVTGDATSPAYHYPRKPAELGSFLDQGLDIFRSLWDRDALIAHLDIEYVNFDFPGEAYLEPERVFDLQRPLEKTVETFLLEHGIVPLHLLSGRGHHFVWRIKKGSAAFSRLAALGEMPPQLEELYTQPHPPEGESVAPELGSAFAGLGLVMEYLGHRLRELASPLCGIPVELTALAVGQQRCGREMLSIDISEYGDPLTSRMIRAPFSSYLKPWQQRWVVGERVLEVLPPLFLIPLHEMDSRQGSAVMRNPERVMELASRASVKIPEQSRPMEQLIADYESSELRRFHEWFYSQEQHPPELWPQTYDCTPMEMLPASARDILQHPNDLLLRPSGLRHVTRCMLALGWHPRHIAGLVTSKFERDFGWGDLWAGYTPAMRADFYVRLFSGLLVVGGDNLADFDAHSATEHQLCFPHTYETDLEPYRQSLLNRRQHERLASRPFNRLFLPEEYPRMLAAHP